MSWFVAFLLLRGRGGIEIHDARERRRGGKVDVVVWREWVGRHGEGELGLVEGGEV